MARPRQSNNSTGGQKNRIPRSLGATFEVIRKSLGYSQIEMQVALNSTNSPYVMPQSKKRSSTEGAIAEQNLSATVSSWELATVNVPFSVQHRYGILSNSYSGVIHLVSLAYANLRDAQHADGKMLSAKEILDQNKDIAEGLIRLATKIIELSENNNCGKLSRDSAAISDIDRNVLKQLLESFSGKELARASDGQTNPIPAAVK